MRITGRFILAGATLGMLTLWAPGGVVASGGAIVSGGEAYTAAHWNADVDYAVWVPGAYPGNHPDRAASYIYTYQIFNAATSAATLSTFSLGLLADSQAASPGDDATYGLACGVGPLLSRLVGSPLTSIHWVIDVAPGEHTTVLLFSAPRAYTFAQAPMANGGLGDAHLLPTPLPQSTIGGDANLDGQVDLQDFGILKDSFGGPGGWDHGDFNSDGTIDLQDFGILKDNFGAGGLASVPEPATLLLLVAGELAILIRRGRK